MTATTGRDQPQQPAAGLPVEPRPANPWLTLWAMLVGFFMILVDSTIVAVANPAIMAALDITDYDTVVWATSAYLLAYAVPLLFAGRLGDRFGPKNLYIAGLAVFTAASVWCGFADSIGMLVAARVAQGIGAAAALGAGAGQEQFHWDALCPGSTLHGSAMGGPGARHHGH